MDIGQSLILLLSIIVYRLSVLDRPFCYLIIKDLWGDFRVALKFVLYKINLRAHCSIGLVAQVARAHP